VVFEVLLFAGVLATKKHVDFYWNVAFSFILEDYLSMGYLGFIENGRPT